MAELKKGDKVEWESSGGHSVGTVVIGKNSIRTLAAKCRLHTSKSLSGNQNRQRQEIGRFCATWSLVALLVQFVLLGLLAAQSTPLLMKTLIPILEAQSKGSSGGGSNALPNIGGGGDGN